MEQIDRDRIIDRFPSVYEFIEEVGVWEFNIQDCPITLKIKVKKFAPNTYYGLANYGIKNPQQAGPYKSMHNQRTVQEALEDALSGFMAYFKPELADETEFIPTEDW